MMFDESLDESLKVNKYTNTTKEGRHVCSSVLLLAQSCKSTFVCLISSFCVGKIADVFFQNIVSILFVVLFTSTIDLGKTSFRNL